MGLIDGVGVPRLEFPTVDADAQTTQAMGSFEKSMEHHREMGCSGVGKVSQAPSIPSTEFIAAPDHPVKLLPDHGADHLVGCVYREISCFFPNCQELVSVKQIETHLDVAHQHVANEVLHLLESGQTNIAAIAFALQDYQEPLLVNFKRLN